MENIQPSRWTLDTLLTATEGPEFERLLAELEQQVAQAEASRDRLSPQIGDDDFLSLLRLLEQIQRIERRLSMYAELCFAENTQSQAAMSLLGRMEQLSADVRNRLLFFALWWKTLDDEPAARLLAISGDYRYHLESLRRFKPHTLSEAEEKIINLKNVNGVNALVALYQTITNRFSYRLTVDGQEKEVTRAELTSYYYDPRPEQRAAAYRALLGTYETYSTVLGQIYAHRVRDWASENVTVRHFPSPIAMRNLENDIPDPVVETLLGVVRDNMPIFQRYFRWKAHRLGMERLRRYDLYAPLRATERRYSFAEAVQFILETFARFSPTLAGHARRIFDDRHLDAEIRPGKESGAFCASVLPALTPWVLVNYAGQMDSMLTLAHELGHAVHALMAGEHSVFTFHSALPMAETASIFSEILLTDRLLCEENDPQVRSDLLAKVLDDAYATIARQAHFVIFEQEAHPRVVAGALTDDLCALYLDDLHRQFGNAIEISEDFRWEWLAIPHLYHTPFYCYAYAFGHLLVLSLYRQYRDEGASFVPRYLQILATGGAASPTQITRQAGFDIASPDFWQGGFDVLGGMLEELETL